MIEDISIEEFYKLTKNINTNEKWEQILAMPDAYQKAHHLFSCSKYNKKVSSILFKFFQSKNLIKKTNSLHVDQIERLKKLPSHERNATIINISRVSSVYELAFLVNTFSDEMDIKTLRRLLDEKDGLKDLIEKPKFSSECLKNFYFGKDNIFADDHMIICSVKKFEYDMYREEILKIIKNLTPEEMLKFKKKATSWQNGIYQSYFESFLDDMLGTIDYLGEDFYIKLYETKVNKMRHKVLSFKSEEKRKIDLLLKMDFKHPVVFVSRQFDVNTLSKLELQKLREKNITPLLLSKEKIYEYGKGLYFHNALSVLNGNLIDLNNYIATLSTKLELEDLLSMFDSGYVHFRQPAYDSLKYPNLLVHGDKLDFQGFKELIQLNEKV